MIYLDNAATSNPKLAACLEKGMREYLELGASPGRGGYDASVLAQQRAWQVRTQVADFFGAPGYITCFGLNATDALNTLIQGLVKPGGHVVSTRLEHNSVLRPLNHLSHSGVCSFELAPFNGQGQVEPEAIAKALRPDTCLVVLNHASNVLGTIQPVAEIGRICREHNIPLILDASQSAGLVPIEMAQWGVSALAFTGHKSLLCASGIGGLVIEPALQVNPSRFGGTGIDSANPMHSMDYPERLEPGTINLMGILNLGHCLEHLGGPEGRKADRQKKQLFDYLLEALGNMPGVELHCADPAVARIPLVSCNLKGWITNNAGMVLDGDYDIAVRTGLHCAPLVHQDLGNGDAGSMRISLGPFNNQSEIDALLQAFTEMLEQV